MVDVERSPLAIVFSNHVRSCNAGGDRLEWGGLPFPRLSLSIPNCCPANGFLAFAQETVSRLSVNVMIRLLFANLMRLTLLA